MDISLLRNRNYLSASFMADYIILYDANVIFYIYTDKIDTLEDTDDKRRQVLIGTLAMNYMADTISAANLKKLAEVIDYLFKEKNKKKHTKEAQDAGDDLDLISETLMKAMYVLKDESGETCKKEIGDTVEKILAKYKKNDKTCIVHASRTYKLIQNKFRMYSFETEDLRQCSYSLWMFVCDLPEIYCEYIKKIEKNKLTPEMLGRLLFYRRMVDVGCRLSVEEKLEEIRRFEFEGVK